MTSLFISNSSKEVQEESEGWCPKKISPRGDCLRPCTGAPGRQLLANHPRDNSPWLQQIVTAIGEPSSTEMDIDGEPTSTEKP